MAMGDNGARLNWELIASDYIEGVAEHDTTMWLSMDQIADRHGINRSHCRERGQRERWVERRAAFQRRVHDKRAERRVTEVAREGADLDIAALDAAKHGLKVTGERLRELAAFSAVRADALDSQIVDAENDGHHVHPDLLPGDPVAAREIELLGRAATDFYALGVRAIGEAPKVAIEIEQPPELTGEARDARAVGILAIMRDHDLLPPELESVIDVSAGRIREVAGGHEGGDMGDAALPPDQ